jgi:23S rRNA (adenine2503-C2)-methyltransferase
MASFINGMTRQEIARALEKLGEPKYRARQICEWLYKKRARSFDEMTNLSLQLRDSLSRKFAVLALGAPARKVSAADGTLKFGLTLPDGNEIETVFLPHPRGATLCISSQVGCGFACKFCATGRMGLTRDLEPAEIVGQVLLAMDETGEGAGAGGREGERPFNNIVFMGMGEPLGNYANTMKAVAVLVKEVGVGARRITISTSGLPEEMMRLAREPYEVGLAVSLNAATDEKRRKLMPVAGRAPLVKLMNAARYYYETKKRFLTFEYVLIKDVNDSTGDAHTLAGLTREVPAKINLIALNPFPGCAYERPEARTVEKFETILRGRGRKVTVRRSLGGDIQAGCGQLAVKKRGTRR